MEFHKRISTYMVMRRGVKEVFFGLSSGIIWARNFMAAEMRCQIATRHAGFL